MKRKLALLSLSLLVSCSNQPLTTSSRSPAEQCPEFSAQLWQPLEESQLDAKQLLDQHTFALEVEQNTLWFSNSSAQLIGLCILPTPRDRRPTNDCGTIYVTYHKIAESWQLFEQQMRICPG